MGLNGRRGFGPQGRQEHRRTTGQTVCNVRVHRTKTHLSVGFGPFGIRFELVGGDLIRPNGIVGPVGPGPCWGHLRVIPPNPVVSRPTTSGWYFCKKFHQSWKQPMALKVHHGCIRWSLEICTHRDNTPVALQQHGRIQNPPGT